MKRFLISLLLISTACTAQDYYYQPKAAPYTRQHKVYNDSLNQNKFFFSINAGISVPKRQFASKDTSHNFMIYGPDTTDGRGFANIGVHACMKGGMYLAPYFGLVAKIGFNYNSFDDNTLNADINGKYYYTINQPFYIWQFMAGVFGNFKLENEQSIWVEGLIGDVNANFPSFTVTIFNLDFNFQLQNANDLGYCLAAGYEKEISGATSFIANITYTASNLSYPTQTYNRNYIGTYTQHTPITMTFGSLDFTIGLLFHF